MRNIFDKTFNSIRWNKLKFWLTWGCGCGCGRSMIFTVAPTPTPSHTPRSKPVMVCLPHHRCKDIYYNDYFSFGFGRQNLCIMYSVCDSRIIWANTKSKTSEETLKQDRNASWFALIHSHPHPHINKLTNYLRTSSSHGIYYLNFHLLRQMSSIIL